MDKEIKPCPFCSNKMRLYVTEKYNLITSYTMFCPACKTKGPAGTCNKEAIERWNTRAEQPKVKPVKTMREGQYNCPTCDNEIWRFYKYCPECGPIDWEGVE